MTGRRAGIGLALALSGIAVLPLVRGHQIRYWAVASAAVALAIAWRRPAILRPVARLAEIVQFGIAAALMAIAYFGILTPAAWLIRPFRQDPLGLRFDRGRDTYWVTRAPDHAWADRLKRPY